MGNFLRCSRNACATFYAAHATLTTEPNQTNTPLKKSERFALSRAKRANVSLSVGEPIAHFAQLSSSPAQAVAQPFASNYPMPTVVRESSAGFEGELRWPVHNPPTKAGDLIIFNEA